MSCFFQNVFVPRTIVNNDFVKIPKTILSIRYTRYKKIGTLLLHFYAKRIEIINENDTSLRKLTFTCAPCNWSTLHGHWILTVSSWNTVSSLASSWVLLEGFLSTTPFTLALYPAFATELEDAVSDHYWSVERWGLYDLSEEIGDFCSW